MKCVTSFLLSCSSVLFLLVLPKGMVEALRCYACLYNSAQRVSGCQKLNTSITLTKTCGPSQPYCKVERIVLDNDVGKFYRGCQETCKPECMIAKGHEKCISCCQTDLCNVGNGGQRQHPVDTSNLILVLPVAFISNVATFLGL